LVAKNHSAYGKQDDRAAMRNQLWQISLHLARKAGYISQQEEAGMLVTTTPTIEGHVIKDYHGVVCGEAILGANIVRDLFASVTDIVGGRSGAYEQELGRARQIALDEMQSQATALGGNAVVGVDIDYEVVRQGMLMVSVSGTAVTIE
jgi:uncharacterized protein YbjQ (UPF0145 family)